MVNDSTAVQAQPYHISCSLLAGDEERGRSGFVQPIHVGTAVYAQSHEVYVAAFASDVQRSVFALRVRPINVGAAGEQQPRRV